MIPHLIFWVRRFFVVCYSAGDIDRSIKSAVAVTTSGTPLTIPRPTCPILSSRVYSEAFLVVPHIFYRQHPLLNPSYHIYFLSPSSHLFSTSLLPCPCLRHRLFCRVYPELEVDINTVFPLGRLVLSNTGTSGQGQGREQGQGQGRGRG